MAKKKIKEPIPDDIAARVLFLSDRVCCVCRVRGKPVQIHHIDEEPSNYDLKNLAVLCFDCHRETQISGGFDRKLDADQVILYRDDWLRLVAQQRANYKKYEVLEGDDSYNVELVTTVAEIYRENQEYELLAMHYHSIGNIELRDKYIELAIKQDPHDQTICFLRSMQGKPDLIPAEVIEREVMRYTQDKDWLQRARFYKGLGKTREAISDYILGINKSLQDNRYFSAAFYLKEFVEEGLLDELFILALRQSADEGDLWWQIRALQELGWHKELDKFVLKHAEEIEKSGNPMMTLLLASAKGDTQKYVEIRKALARTERMGIVDKEDEDAETNS
ncbi:MAG: HNH endonuclease signature motif containing protein [Anaerolineae bacterium]